jgi:hypothetical protein
MQQAAQHAARWLLQHQQLPLQQMHDQQQQRPQQLPPQRCCCRQQQRQQLLISEKVAARGQDFLCQY